MTHLRVTCALIMFSNSMKIEKVDRNMSDLRQIIFKIYVLSICVLVHV